MTWLRNNNTHLNEKTTVASPIEPVVMCQAEYNTLIHKVFNKQKSLASNSNFYIKGFDRHVYATLLQAFAEELNLIKITDT